MIYFLFLFAAIGAGYGQVADTDPSQVTLLGTGVGSKGTNFYVYGQGSWHSAPTVCQLNNKKLIKIDSAEKNEDVEYFLKRHSATFGPFWTQGNRLYDGSTWVFLDQEPMKYFNWGPSHPRHDDYHCIEIFRNGKWNPASCYKLKHVICED